LAANLGAGAAELLGAGSLVDEASEALTAFLGRTTLAAICAAGAAGLGLGLAAVADEPAHPRDGGQPTTQKGTGEQAQRPTPRHGGAS